jgi:hypothetical protein
MRKDTWTIVRDRCYTRPVALFHHNQNPSAHGNITTIEVRCVKGQWQTREVNRNGASVEVGPVENIPEVVGRKLWDKVRRG